MNDTATVVAFCLGFGIMLVIHLWGRWMYLDMLKKKAEVPDRTAECIQGEFFYIVPEGEYVDMKHQSLCFKRDHGI